MNIKELNKYLQSLPDDILDDAAQIVAETATEYYKETFTRKAFDKNPWVSAKIPKRTGSLLVDSGALLNSIRPTLISTHRVVISAGNDKVDYAQVNNEGFTGSVAVPAHTRKTKKWGDVQVKAHTRQANIPQREFLGDSKELNEQIYKRIEGYVDSLK